MLPGAKQARNAQNGKKSYPETHRGQLLDEVVGSSKRGQPDLLRKFGEGRIGEKRDVADQLVADVRLRRVERLRRVADVLQSDKNDDVGRSIHIERACELHGSKMTQHDLLHKGLTCRAPLQVHVSQADGRLL